MSILFLKRLESGVEADKALLDVFQRCREHVVRVTATHLLPDHIAITTRGGFIQLIETSKGEFRLYLTHLEQHVPLDSALRCFSLVPSYSHRFSLSSDECPGMNGRLYLLYSLAFSNELLLADMENGRIRTLSTFHTRPSTVFCDGDYMVCGEGGGQISVWRCSHEERGHLEGRDSSDPKLLWQEAIFDDSVTSLRVQGDRLICCSANYHFYMLSVDTGVVLATLTHEPDLVVATLPLAWQLAHRFVMVVCLASRILVHVEAEPLFSTADTQVATPPLASSAFSWPQVSSLQLDIPIQCVTCRGNYLAAGTASGVVLLYHCDSETSHVRELVRFDVGYGVVGMQLYLNETLLVVTSTGDVWKWPLADLLESMHEQEDAEGAALSPPQPLAAPLPFGQESNEISGVTPNERSVTLMGEDGGEKSGLCSQDEEGTSLAGESNGAVLAEDQLIDHRATSSRGTPLPSSLIGMGSGGAVGVWAPEASAPVTQPFFVASSLTEPAPSTVSPARAPSCVAQPLMSSVAAKSTMGEGEDLRASHVYEPMANVGSVKSHVAMSAEEGGSTIENRSPERQENSCNTLTQVESGNSSSSVAIDDEPEVIAIEEQPAASFPSSFIHISSPVSVEGLEAGPHVDFGAEAIALTASTLPENEAKRDDTVMGLPPNAAAACGADGMKCGAVALVDKKITPTTHSRPYQSERELAAVQNALGPLDAIAGLRKGRRMDPRYVKQLLETEVINQQDKSGREQEAFRGGLQSTAMLLEKQFDLKHTMFDLNAYAKEHALEVEALPYRHPVKLPLYTLEDRVFAAGLESIKNDNASGKLRIGANGVASSSVIIPTEDGAGERKLAATESPGESRGVTDDLMNATVYRFSRRRDPDREEERQYAGPDITMHSCEDLLYPAADPSATVLFREYQMKPSALHALSLPMPFPPTPSVF